jgi:hypothetical protein
MAFNRRKWLLLTIGMTTAIPLGRHNPDLPPHPPVKHPPTTSDPEKQPPQTDGTYLTYVGGYLTGSGTSKVGHGSVIISAGVTTADGLSTTLSATSLTLSGNHFAGTGTAAGCSTLTIVGRLDGYKNDANFRGARVLAYYTDGSGHNGKLGGVIVP